MIDEDHPTLTLYDQDAWATERNYAGEDPKRVLAELHASWDGLASLLEGLSDDGWSRRGVHPEAGATTVRACAAGEVQHSAQHMERMRAVRAVVQAD